MWHWREHSWQQFSCRGLGKTQEFQSCSSGVFCWIYCAHTKKYKNSARAEPSPTLLQRNQQQKIICAAEPACRTFVPLFSVIPLESYSEDSTSLKLPQLPLHCHQRQGSLKALESRKGEKQVKFALCSISSTIQSIMACSLLLFIYLLNEHPERDILSFSILCVYYIHSHSLFCVLNTFTLIPNFCVLSTSLHSAMQGLKILLLLGNVMVCMEPNCPFRRSSIPGSIQHWKLWWQLKMRLSWNPLHFLHCIGEMGHRFFFSPPFRFWS